MEEEVKEEILFLGGLLDGTRGLCPSWADEYIQVISARDPSSPYTIPAYDFIEYKRLVDNIFIPVV